MKTPAISAAQPSIDTPPFIALLICTDAGRRLLGNMSAAACSWVRAVGGGHLLLVIGGMRETTFKHSLSVSLFLDGKAAVL